MFSSSSHAILVVWLRKYYKLKPPRLIYPVLRKELVIKYKLEFSQEKIRLTSSESNI